MKCVTCGEREMARDDGQCAECGYLLIPIRFAPPTPAAVHRLCCIHLDRDEVARVDLVAEHFGQTRAEWLRNAVIEALELGERIVGIVGTSPEEKR